MGNKCCTDRKEIRSHGPAAGPTEQPDKERSNTTKIKHIAFKSIGDDASAFDKAFESNDLQALVGLLNSSQPIESFEQRMHPWAEDPKTIGALAATQFAILASMADQTDDSDMKVRIRQVGAIPRLCDFLRSTSPDRIQTAVVALSFLTANCEDNAQAVIRAGALVMLMHHQNSPVAGMRVATSTTLRNLCVASEECRDEFVRRGGLKAIIKQLSQDPHPSLSHVDVQLESVLNLQDIIIDDAGNVVEKYRSEVERLGAEEKLALLSESEDDEVRLTAQELFNLLTDVNRAESAPRRS